MIIRQLNKYVSKAGCRHVVGESRLVIGCVRCCRFLPAGVSSYIPSDGEHIVLSFTKSPNNLKSCLSLAKTTPTPPGRLEQSQKFNIITVRYLCVPWIQNTLSIKIVMACNLQIQFPVLDHYNGETCFHRWILTVWVTSCLKEKYNIRDM